MLANSSKWRAVVQTCGLNIEYTTQRQPSLGHLERLVGARGPLQLGAGQVLHFLVDDLGVPQPRIRPVTWHDN